MTVQQKLDKVLENVRERVQEEVGALMGVDFKLSDLFSQYSTQEDYLAEQSGKKIIAEMDITGDIEGHGALVTDIKDAIRLGGTLIMLPQSELDEVVNSENYSEETEDSYGEIANIIAGSYTKVFEELFPKSCRFIRKQQTIVAPLKIDVSAEEPFPAQWYYVAKSSMSLDGVQMGDIDMLLPAEAFGMEIPETAKEEDKQGLDSQETTVNENTPSNSESEVASDREKNPEPILDTEDKNQSALPDTDNKPVIKDIKKHRKLVNSLLTASNDLLAQEVGALLGIDIKLKDYSFEPIAKEEFFLDGVSGKQVLTHMDLVDGAEGKGYLFIGLKDAIRLGSILIMLPPSELEIAINEDELSPDAEDAYGEIANIISGAYTSVFQEQYKDSIRFIKTDLETVVPMKVDGQSDDVIPHQHYYLSTSSLYIEDQQYGNINMLIPISLLQLDQLLADQQKTYQPEENNLPDNVSSITSDSSTPTTEAGATEALSANHKNDSSEILIIENNREEADKVTAELDQMGISSKSIGFNENISYHLHSQLRLVIIVMQDVDEQAFGVTIKVNSHAAIPIVAAGAQWTRTKVIKAVKYGINDILLTPASRNDIQEKIQNNIMQMAA